MRVAIIGGGIMGCAIALRLAQRGARVVVLERSIPGAEASSAAAGILAPQYEAEKPGPLFDLGLRSRARFPEWVAELRAATGLDVGYRPSGLIAVADQAGAPALETRLRWQREAGLRIERLSPDVARRREPALGDHALAVHFPDEAQVEPPLLMRALQIAAARAGVDFAARYVQRVVHQNDRVRGVESEGELVEADAVVLAAGSWSSLVEGCGLPSRAVRPMRGQMVELETRPAPFSHVLFGTGGYLVPRDDGRVVVGSTMELAGFHKEVTAAGLERLLALAQRIIPTLSAATVRRFWSGFRPYTEDHLPFLGKTRIAGLCLATGHFRNGILLAPITADAVAAAVLSDPSPIDLAPFSIDRLA